MPRSAPRSKPTSLTADAWAHFRVRELELPSGAGTISVKPLKLGQMLLGGLVPNHLRAVAIRMEYENALPPELDPENEEQMQRVREFEEFKDWAVVETAQVPGISVKWVQENLADDDREAIFAMATHQDLLAKLVKFRLQPTGVGRGGAGSNGGTAAE
jgi:hypothetical protein